MRRGRVDDRRLDGAPVNAIAGWPSAWPSTSASLCPLAVLGLVLSSVGCCGTRLNVNCPLPLAVTINVVDADGGASIQGAVVHVSGPVLESYCAPSADPSVCEVHCAGGSCWVPGHSGTYALEVGAPGFQSTRLSVIVRDRNERCEWCEAVATASLHVALVKM